MAEKIDVSKGKRLTEEELAKLMILTGCLYALAEVERMSINHDETMRKKIIKIAEGLEQVIKKLILNVEQSEVWYDLDGAQNIRAGDYGNNILCFKGGAKKLTGDTWCAGTFVHTSASINLNGFTIHTI